MKYTKEERIDIGRRVYNNEITRREAMIEYNICESAIDFYVKMYRQANNLPSRDCRNNPLKSRAVLPEGNTNYEEFASMSREELIGEIIKARINEARAKKGYIVKGDGAQKEYEPIVNKNTK